MTSPEVLLPPAGPALTLHAAAARLRTVAEAALALMARNDYWSAGWRRGVENAIGDEEGVLAGLFSPEMALELADELDRVAHEAVRHAAGRWGNCESEVTDGWPMAMARRILEAS